MKLPFTFSLKACFSNSSSRLHSFVRDSTNFTNCFRTFQNRYSDRFCLFAMRNCNWLAIYYIRHAFIYDIRGSSILANTTAEFLVES